MANYFSLKDGDFRSSGVFGASTNDLVYNSSTTNQYVNTFGVLALDNFSDIFTISNTAITGIAIQIDKIYSTSGNLRLDINYTTDNTTLCAVTEYYPLTSFSKTIFTGTRTFDYNSVFPEKFQILRLTNTISAASASVRYKLTTPSDNQIYLNGIPRFNGLINIGDNPTITTTAYAPPTALDGTINFDGSNNNGTTMGGSTNRYLIVGSSTDSSFAVTNANLGGGDGFTVEGFVKFATPSTDSISMYKDGVVGTSLFSWGCIIKQSGLVFEIGSGVAGTTTYQTYSAAPVTIPANTWQHFAFSRYGVSLYMHLNGVVVASFDMSTYNNGNFKNNTTPVYIGNSTYPLHIGRNMFNGANRANSVGSITNVRITKNTPVYANGPITPPIPNWLQSIDDGIFTVNKITTVGPTPKFNASVVTTNSVPLSSTSPDNVYICRSIYPNSAVVPINITANSNLTVNNLYVYDQGTLSFPLTSNTTIRANGSYGIGVSLSGTLNVGTSSSPIPLSTTHAINLYSNAINVYENGNLNVYGYAKPLTTNLISDVANGVRTFSATDSISDTWSVGDTLAFKPNLASRTSFDYLTLSSFVDSNVFTTTSNSSYSHTGSATFGFIPTVYNLSRNVKINGVDTTYRGTIRSYDSSKVNINYAQFSNFGVTSKLGVANNYGIHPKNNTSGSCILSGNSFINDGNNETVLFKNNKFVYKTYFNGTTDSYQMANTNIAYLHKGTTDFTVEAWVYLNSSPSSSYSIFATSVNTGNVGISFRINTGNLLSFYVYKGGGGSTIGTSYIAAFSALISLYTWTHVCVTYNSTTKIYSCFINGVLTDSISFPSFVYSTAADTFALTIGRAIATGPQDVNYFNGYMTNLRIRSVVQYTSSFTPSYELQVIDNNTTLLTLQNSPSAIDNSNSPNLLTTTGSPTVSLWDVYNYVGDDTVVNNTTISNNIFWKSKNPTTTGIIPLQNYNLNTFKFNNNYILNSYGDGLILSGNTGAAANVTNNVIIGALGNGTYLTNNTLSGSFVNNNYANGSYGMLLSGVNNSNLSISGGGIYSGKDGIYVDTSTVNINSLQFNNVVTSNNASVGLNLSGASLVYSTQINLNINGLTASNNSKEGVNINSNSFNLSSVTLNNTVANSNGSVGFNLSGSYKYFNSTELSASNNIKEGVYLYSSSLSSITATNTTTNNNSSVGFKLSGNSNYLTPVKTYINGLTASNNTNLGVELYNITGNLTSLNLSNNLSGGIKTSIGIGSIIFDTINATVSTNTNAVSISSFTYEPLVINNALLSASSVSGIALNLSADKMEELNIYNSTLTAATPLKINTPRSKIEGSYLFYNCNSDTYGLSSLALTGYQSNVFQETGFSIINENNTVGNTYRYLAAGKISYDSSIVHTPGNVASEKLEPTSTIIKLRSGSRLISLNASETLTINVFIKKSSNYTGSAPRLMLKSNSAIGYTDTVLATSIAANDTWELLESALPIPTSLGVAEVYIDCSGPVGSGSINIDDWDLF